MTHHPLEPLNACEVEDVVNLLRSLDFLKPTIRIISIMLHEPDKSYVYASPDGPSPDREAAAILFSNLDNACVVVTVNLTTRKVTKTASAPVGSQPTISIDEQVECEQVVLASEDFRAALRKHYGVTDTSLVMVDIWSAGNYGSKEDCTRRLARPLCFLRSDPTDNGYAKPIEGIRPVVDLNLMKVIRVEEFGTWPLPPGTCNYAADRISKYRTDIKSLDISQPEGPSFTLDGNHICWQNWEFVIGFNAREGLTIHDLRYSDQGQVTLADSLEVKADSGEWIPASAMTEAYIGLGKKDRAFFWFNRCVAEHSCTLLEANAEPIYSGLSGDRRFEKIAGPLYGHQNELAQIDVRK